jgi:hypothetical protein
MGRAIGKLPFPANFEIGYNQPIDARTVIPYFTGLTDNTTIPFPYSGMVVSVVNDSTEKNGLYFLKKPDAEGQPFASGQSQWIKIGGDSITGNTWTYSSDTLNLQMSTGGTISLTGFTFVNTTGDTILGQLIISADTNPLILSGLTGSTTSVDTDTKFLILDVNNNVIYQTGVTSTVITSNTWTYSSDTLNLLYSTGGTIPLTGFTFVNTTGDTILGKLVISAETNPLNLSGLTASTSSVDTDTKFLTLDQFNNVIYQTGVTSTVITSNTWTYSSDTLNLQMSTGGTIPLTGFTFVNTTGDTILGQLTISADTNPLNLSGLTASTTSVDTNTKFLSLDSNNNVIIQTGVTSTVITSNTWTYSSDTLNLQMSTGGTIPLTGFTFVNTTGDTILGKLTISADTNPLNLSGLTATTSALTVNTKFLSLDENNNVIIQTGISVSNASALSGGVTNYLSKWTGTSAITTTLLRTTNDGSKLAIGLPSGDTISYPLMISADTNPISIKGIVSNAFDSANQYLYVNTSTGVIGSTVISEQTGITVYISARTNSGQVDFIQTGSPENFRSVYYNYHLKSLSSYSIRSGTLQAVWGTGATADLNYTDQGPLQIIEGANTISGINVSGVTGGISVVIEVANGNWEFKAYRVKL